MRESGLPALAMSGKKLHARGMARNDAERLLELEESAQGVDLYRAPGSELQFEIAAEEAEVHSEPDEVHEASVLKRAQKRRAFLWNAMTGLENAAAGPSSSGEWLTGVDDSLARLSEALEEHIEVVEGTNGLFDEIMATSPRLAPEMESLRDEHRQLVTSLTRAIDVVRSASTDSNKGPKPVRRAVTSLLGRLTRHRQRGSDLVFDAYNVDIAAAD